MSFARQQIVADFTAHIKKRGGAYSAWYVGITKDASDRLFVGHSVSKEKDAWIYRQADSNSTARDVESYFVNTVGTDGGTGGGDFASNYVYAYKKNQHTNP